MGGISTQIPENWNLPLFWATVDGSQAGNLTEQLPALLVGQYNAQGTAQTTASTATTSATLTFGGGVPAFVVPGMTVSDLTTPGAISTQTVLSVTATTVVLTANVTSTVNSGDVINFAASSPGQANAVTPNVPIPIGSVAQSQALFGVGSMLARMVQAFFADNTIQLLYALPVPDPTVGVKASGSIAITSGPTASGVLTLYIAGQVVSVSVASTDTPSSIATNLAAAINALTSLPIVAVVDGTHNFQVDITCRWAGLTGNDITIIPNYRGILNGEQLPAGVTLTITPMASGTGEPTFSAAISAIQMLEFDYVGMPYTDAASMAAWNSEYGFSSGGRWNFTRQQYGFIVNAYRNSYSSAITFGLTINSPVMSTMVIEPLAPSPIWEWTAEYCALAALGFSDDPARPLQTLEMQMVLPATLPNRFTQSNLNNLTNGGFAIQTVDPAGNAMILREQTQYQFNQFGQGDTAFGLLTVLATLSELLRRMKSSITSKYPRMKLVPDGTKLSPGQAAVTPTDVKAELIAEFVDAEYDGLVADLTDFQNNLVVQIDPDNPNKLQVLWPPQLAGQLRQFDVLAQFRLLYPTVSVNS